MKPLTGIGEETLEPNEKETIETVTKIMRAAATFTSALGPLRVPHVKSHGCVDATFIVNDDLPAEYAVGIFRKDEHGKGRSYPAGFVFRMRAPSIRTTAKVTAAVWPSRCLSRAIHRKSRTFFLEPRRCFSLETVRISSAFVEALTIFNGREKLKETHFPI